MRLLLLHSPSLQMKRLGAAAMTAASFAPASSMKKDSIVKSSARASRTPLVFLLWNKSDVWPVQPWECIPVTRKEAAAFRQVPASKRAELVSETTAVQLGGRLYALRNMCLAAKAESVIKKQMLSIGNTMQ
jgi:hypothetical protein